MKNFLIACLACTLLLLTSCGISRDATTNNNVAQTEVVLAQKNYKVVGIVSGESSQNYWFGIGGLSKKSLGSSATAEMYKNANLQGSQAIINVNITYKNKFALIYSGVTAIATGTVIQFVENDDEEVASPSQFTHVSKQIVPTSPTKRAYYQLSYLMKKKNTDKWSVEKEEVLNTTYDDALKIAADWNKQTSDKFDYKCNVKKAKNAKNIK